ncbi:CapA family protein [Patulibacter americanus]|uniref:CapA family protein n=1 Tax=Patulibacter americanus TaxID=588672 RepID=UPI0003B6BDFF|nr:CapA family protein [Patulibacter americanus]
MPAASPPVTTIQAPPAVTAPAPAPAAPPAPAAAPAPAPTPSPGPAPTPPSRRGTTRAPAAVAPGGLLRLRARGVALPAQAQQRVGRKWVRRGDPIGSASGSTSFRIGTNLGRETFRLVGADGVPTRARRVRVRPLTLASVGDINLAPAPLGAIAGGNVDAPWRSVGPVLKRADLALGNLECAISLGGSPFPKQYRFRGSPRALRAATRLAGFDVLNLANNHTGDYGQGALFDTIRNVGRAGASAVGAGASTASAYRPVVRTKLGLKVAFVAFNEILPPEFRATDTRPGVAWSTPEAVRATVRRAAGQADVVVAAFHWGDELATRPSGRQVALAKTALDAGATAVVGAHPHVLQPIVRSGGRVVAYSLGNFVFPSGSPGTTRTGILELRLGAGRVLSHRFRPATIRGATPVLR